MDEDPIDGLYDPTKFVATTVPWILTHPKQPNGITEEDVFRLTLTKDGNPAGVVVPLFTDEDLAERFVAQLGENGKDLEYGRIGGHPKWFGDVLEVLQSQGVTHVCFDPGPGRSLHAASIIAIAKVIAVVRSAERSAIRVGTTDRALPHPLWVVATDAVRQGQRRVPSRDRITTGGESQRSLLAARLANMRHGAPKGNKNAAGDKNNSANLPNCSISQSDAAKACEVSTRLVTAAAKVISQGVPELVAAVWRVPATISRRTWQLSSACPVRPVRLGRAPHLRQRGRAGG